jgi:hypothetical protein
MRFRYIGSAIKERRIFDPSIIYPQPYFLSINFFALRPSPLSFSAAQLLYTEHIYIAFPRSAQLIHVFFQPLIYKKTALLSQSPRFAPTTISLSFIARSKLFKTAPGNLTSGGAEFRPIHLPPTTASTHYQ